MKAMAGVAMGWSRVAASMLNQAAWRSGPGRPDDLVWRRSSSSHSGTISTRNFAPRTQLAAPANTVPPITRPLIDTLGPVLSIAPRSPSWAETASRQLSFLPVGSSERDIEAFIERQRPSVLVVADQAISRTVLSAWREACPLAPLTLVRRGTSLDRIDLAACRDFGIKVMNTPGVNATHVARWAVDTLAEGGGAPPRRLAVVGHGQVGQAVVEQMLERAPSSFITVVRRGHGERAEAGRSKPAPDPVTAASAAGSGRPAVTTNPREALGAADAAVVCVSINESSIGMIDEAHIDALRPGSKIVCVSKPAVFTDAALRRLASRGDVVLHLDYGRSTLEDFERRLDALGCPAATWRSAPRLTTAAATSAACQQDLDHAVSVQLACMALDGFVGAQSNESFRIPDSPPPPGAPRATVVGCGINGVFQALMLRLAGYEVTVHGGDAPDDGASHKRIDMRHLSATETTAKPVANRHLTAGHADLVINFNLAGMALFRKLLADNPALRPYAKERLMRAFPAGEEGTAASIELQRKVAARPWPGGHQAEGAVELDAGRFEQAHGVPGLERILQVPGYDLAFRGFLAELVERLKQSGVRFTGQRLSKAEIASLGTADAPVVTAMGVDEKGVTPVLGWFLRLRAVGREAHDVRGLKLQYPLPVGVMNCRRDGDDILISGGQVPPGSTPQERERIQAQFLQAVARHFPRSHAAAMDAGPLDLTACARPGSADGLSRAEWAGPHWFLAGATYAGGTTQGLMLAALARREVTRRSRSSE